MKGNIFQLKALSTNNHKSDSNNKTIYMGLERRNERRRESKSERVDIMINNFGLERRKRVEQRKEDTSWLLLSQKAG